MGSGASAPDSADSEWDVLVALVRRIDGEDVLWVTLVLIGLGFIVLMTPHLLAHRRLMLDLRERWAHDNRKLHLDHERRKERELRRSKRDRDGEDGHE